MDVFGWHVVIFGGNGEIRATHFAAVDTQTIECLRAGYFVHQMQIDVEQFVAVVIAMNDVAVPHFLRKGQRLHTSILPADWHGDEGAPKLSCTSSGWAAHNWA